MLHELKLACTKAQISVSEFSRQIGKSRTTVVHVADGKTQSAEVRRKIAEFIAEQLSPGYTPAALLELPGHWLSTQEFAEKAGMRPESVANKARTGGFSKVRRMGKKWLIHKSELEV